MEIGPREISQIAPAPIAWDISHMTGAKKPKGDNAALLARLEAVRPKELSQNEWCKAAKVNTSYFTGLQNGSEPGLYKMERLARIAGLTLAQLLEGTDIQVSDMKHELVEISRDLSDDQARQVLAFAKFVSSGRP
ncbi:MAG: hypothetical protein JWL86_39 [Rhizobium sp.]|nr:hypothetical protein [Rhizobium sp.]